jgi:Protein of unknown function (DUF1638)
LTTSTYTNPLGIAANRTLVLACATVIEEMQSMLPAGIPCQVLEFGLHLRPKLLTQALQAAIDQSPDVDLILLGYGLCSRAVIGLKSARATLVVPRTDDCIAIFLGSRDAYQNQMNRELGTYYLTKGWIEVGDTPFEEHTRLVKRYGEEKAAFVIKMLLKNYTRLALIKTGSYDLEKYRDYARRTAERFGLRFEEIEGAPSLVKKLLFGPWDDEIVVCPPGQAITDEMFWQPPAG